MTADMDAAREYYDNNSTADELAAALDDGTAVYETATDSNPMIGLSVRVPRRVLRALRTRAAAQGVKPTVLARELIEAGIVDPATPSHTVAMAEVRRAIRAAQRALAALEGEPGGEVNSDVMS